MKSLFKTNLESKSQEEFESKFNNFMEQLLAAVLQSHRRVVRNYTHLKMAECMQKHTDGSAVYECIDTETQQITEFEAEETENCSRLVKDLDGCARKCGNEKNIPCFSKCAQERTQERLKAFDLTWKKIKKLKPPKNLPHSSTIKSIESYLPTDNPIFEEKFELDFEARRERINTELKYIYHGLTRRYKYKIQQEMAKCFEPPSKNNPHMAEQEIFQCIKIEEHKMMKIRGNFNRIMGKHNEKLGKCIKGCKVKVECMNECGNIFAKNSQDEIYKFAKEFYI